jgi:hypothetical protein
MFTHEENISLVFLNFFFFDGVVILKIREDIN